MKDIIKFYIREAPYGFLSNFWRSSQNVGFDRYATNEHYYQSQKAKDPRTEEWIRNAPTAYAAMMAGKSLKPSEIVDDWETKKVEVMRKGLLAKFGQNFYLKLALLQTGHAYLIEDSLTDMFWGGYILNSKNMLGNLLMEVREFYKIDLEQKLKEDGILPFEFNGVLLNEWR